MKKRLITAGAIALTLLGFFLLKELVSDYFFDALILVIGVGIAFESSKIFTKMGFFNLIYIALSCPFLLFIGSFLGIYFSLPIWLILLINIATLALLFVVSFLWIILYKGTRNEIRVRCLRDNRVVFALKKSAYTLISCVYPTFMFMIMMYINHFDEFTFGKIINFNGYLSIIVLVTCFLIPILTDTFAMLTGMLIGGKKLCPKISPKKTISGAVGGVVFPVIICAILYIILNATDLFNTIFTDSKFALWIYLIIVFIGSLIAQFGDLFESYLKRRADIKDSGNILPGHGGVLDRFDSYIFEIPFVFLAFCIILLI